MQCQPRKGRMRALFDISTKVSRFMFRYLNWLGESDARGRMQVRSSLSELHARVGDVPEGKRQGLWHVQESGKAGFDRESV